MSRASAKQSLREHPEFKQYRWVIINDLAQRHGRRQTNLSLQAAHKKFKKFEKYQAKKRLKPTSKEDKNA